MKKASLHILKGVRARLEISLDGKNFMADEWVKGPAVIDIKVDQSISKYIRFYIEEALLKEMGK